MRPEVRSTRKSFGIRLERLNVQARLSGCREAVCDFLGRECVTGCGNITHKGQQSDQSLSNCLSLCVVQVYYRVHCVCDLSLSCYLDLTMALTKNLHEPTLSNNVQYVCDMSSCTAYMYVCVHVRRMRPGVLDNRISSLATKCALKLKGMCSRVGCVRDPI